MHTLGSHPRSLVAFVMSGLRLRGSSGVFSTILVCAEGSINCQAYLDVRYSLQLYSQTNAPDINVSGYKFIPDVGD
jgi:hypothetical protein